MLRIDHNVTTVTPLWLIAGATVALVARFAVMAMEANSPPEGRSRIEWQQPVSINDHASLEGKPILYYFTTKWCGACRKLEKQSLDNKQIIAFVRENFQPVQVVDRGVEDGTNSKLVQELEDKYRVSAFPDLVVALPDGSYVSRQVGLSKLAATRTFLRAAVNLARYETAKQLLGNHEFRKADALLEQYTREHGHQSNVIYAEIRRYFAMRFLGRDAEASAFAQKCAEELDQKKWPWAFFGYITGTTDERGVQRIAGDSKTNRIDLRTYRGLLSFFKGESKLARNDLEWVSAQVDFALRPEYKLATYACEQMSKTSKPE
jgi:thiol-disulfide isomerase/thioredoxin